MSENVNGYPEEYQEILKKLNGKRDVTWKQLTENENGTFTVAEYDFYHKDLRPCQTCGSTDYLCFVKQRVGIMKVCMYCRHAEGPLSTETAIRRESKVVSIGEAIEVMKWQGWQTRDTPLGRLLRRAKPKERIERPRPK